MIKDGIEKGMMDRREENLIEKGSKNVEDEVQQKQNKILIQPNRCEGEIVSMEKSFMSADVVKCTHDKT